MDGLTDAIALICLFLAAAVIMRRINGAERWDWARLLVGAVGRRRDGD